MALLSPIKRADWDAAKARHLLNRAGFGVPSKLVEDLVGMGPEAAVAHLVEYDHLHQRLTEPKTVPFLARRTIARDNPEASEEEIQELYTEYRRSERMALEGMKSWWLQRMHKTHRPLEEKMALFWHGHFAISSQKVQSSTHTYEYNALLRDYATGNFKMLTTKVGQLPAMLQYLDNRQSTKTHPNENWARELMELFVLGQGQYTEDDIKASARAFTGWTTSGNGFEYNLQRHDYSDKTFMGRTGPFDGWDIINIIFEQPAASTFISTKLWNFFAYENPEAGVVKGLSETLRDNDFELRPMLTQLFLSKAFYSDKAMGTQIKSPAQFMVRLAEDLGYQQPPYSQMARSMRELGQDLFYPPNVKGWDGNRAWINANSLLIRYNTPPVLANAARTRTQRQMAMRSEQMAGGETMMSEGSAPKDYAGVKTGDYLKEERKAMMTRVREAISELPKREQQAMRKRVQSGDMVQRRKALRELGVRPPAWEAHDPALLFESLKFSTPNECLDALEASLLLVPLKKEQRDALMEALGVTDPDTTITPEAVPYETRIALLRLLTSTAEYQLC